MSDLQLTREQTAYLLTTAAIRERAAEIFARSERGETSFAYDPAKLKPAVDYVLRVIQKKYPDLQIPFHSRWGHFRAGGVDRSADFDRKLGSLNAMEKARAKLDLVITSVLLDAGAGAEWSYREVSSGQSYNRSEGLGVASYHMFCAGAMSSDGKSPRADQRGLAQVHARDLEKHFQVQPENPLVGVDGRVMLLNGLAKAVQNTGIFKEGRPGNIVDYLVEQNGRDIPAEKILGAVLEGFGSIWPGRLSANGVNLGDVWIHPKLGKPGSFESLVPIHKLSQWMTYSLIEPIQEAGLNVSGVEKLTGLAEYRNGGLFLDTGILALRDPAAAAKDWAPDSELIIEWRALTVYLLDQVGAAVQKALGKTPQDFPLAKVLEGGTWWAGRFLAQEKRAGGVPPLNIKSDGTVF
jgi:hypothetical protein